MVFEVYNVAPAPPLLIKHTNTLIENIEYFKAILTVLD